MASLKEIRAKVASIKSTQKITRAMQMVAASKMRRAQESMQIRRPYTQNIRRVISHLMKTSPDYKHPLMKERKVRRVGYIVITSDRGLAGGLNINLLKKLMHHVKQKQEQSIEVCYVVIGQKGYSSIKSLGGEIINEKVPNLGDNPVYESIKSYIDEMIKEYEGKEEKGIPPTIDQVFLVYNDFVNAMTQKPTIKQILPLAEDEFAGDIVSDMKWQYIYEPNEEALLKKLLEDYIQSIVYQGLLENIASEQSARMVAMKAATDNAGNLINELQLVYNKLRQAAITQEISEIVGGAAAVS